jgi:putative DNA primase/helicase
MDLTLAEQYDIYKNNVTKGMLEHFAEELGVTTESIEKLGVGYFPGDYCWIFAERDAKGDIIGLAKRPHIGKKHMIKGSKRGLIYAYNSDHAIGDKKYDAGKFHWVRIANAGVTCPICAKPDWCMVSSDDPENPSAVLCSRIAQGRVREIPGSGHLHIINAARNKNQGSSTSALSPTDLPIIIVEGASDVLAAMSLGFVAIGRPSAEGGMAILNEMPLTGHEVWVIGDNDAGAGEAGMKKAHLNIKEMTKNVLCILPPEGTKDLRQWVQRGLTQASLFEYVGEHGDDNKEVDPNVFADDIAFLIAEQFMNESHMLNGVPILRNYRGQWMQWSKDHYEELSTALFKGELYEFLEGKKFIKTTAAGLDIVPYKPTRSKVNDIIDAMTRWCPVEKDPPLWLDKGDHPHPNNLIIFKNGMLDVTEYMKGNIVLHNPDPRLFTYSVFPYDYDPGVWSNLYDDTCNQIFSEDIECIRALAQWFGYNLVPDMTQEKLMIFIGDTRTGKSTILETLHGMLGKNQYSATSFQALANTHGLYSLIGKLAATLGDARTPRRGEADAALQTILQITGRDSVTVNPKYIQSFDAYLTCRFTIAMNDLPGFTDPAKALVARSIILNFPNSFVDREDFTLKDRLRKEAREGKLINFALQGLKDLREQGRFTMPESSRPLLKQLTEITAPVTAFIGECCIKDAKAYVLKNQLYEAWAIWCSKTGHKVGNNIYFGRWLRQACPTAITFRADINDRRQYAHRGLKLQDWVYDQYLGKPKQ